MVELASGATKLSLHKPDEVGLARARLYWVLRPLGFLGLVLWVLHPTISDRLDLGSMLLMGYLLGALYGLVIFGPRLKRYIVLRPSTGRFQSNRLPQEYYWGEVSEILFENRG